MSASLDRGVNHDLDGDRGYRDPGVILSTRQVRPMLITNLEGGIH